MPQVSVQLVPRVDIVGMMHSHCMQVEEVVAAPAGGSVVYWEPVVGLS